MIQYGLISRTDSLTIQNTLDLILSEFSDEVINVTEIGLFDCGTANGIVQYMAGKRYVNYTGIDNEKDKPIVEPGWMNYIKGNSNEVYNELEDDSQHMIFIDGDHSFIGVITDFYAYSEKVKKGGYLAFHDTGKHIQPFTDFQHGDKENPDAYISVRKALVEIGLFNQKILFLDPPKYKMPVNHVGNDKWKLVFDEADETDRCGGICVFKKLY